MKPSQVGLISVVGFLIRDRSLLHFHLHAGLHLHFTNPVWFLKAFCIKSKHVLKPLTLILLGELNTFPQISHCNVINVFFALQYNHLMRKWA